MYTKRLYLKKNLVKDMDNFIYKEFIVYRINFYTILINRYKHICWQYKKKINVTKRK